MTFDEFGRTPMAKFEAELALCRMFYHGENRGRKSNYTTGFKTKKEWGWDE